MKKYLGVIFGNLATILVASLVFESLYDNQHVAVATLVVFVYISIKESEIKYWNMLKLLDKRLEGISTNLEEKKLGLDEFDLSDDDTDRTTLLVEKMNQEDVINNKILINSIGLYALFVVTLVYLIGAIS